MPSPRTSPARDSERLLACTNVASVEPWPASLRRMPAKGPLIAEIGATKPLIRSVEPDRRPSISTTPGRCSGAWVDISGLAADEVRLRQRRIFSRDNSRGSLVDLRAAMFRGTPRRTGTAQPELAPSNPPSSMIFGKPSAPPSPGGTHLASTGRSAPALRNRFIGRSGSLLLQVYPKSNVWERRPRRRSSATCRLLRQRQPAPRPDVLLHGASQEVPH